MESWWPCRDWLVIISGIFWEGTGGVFTEYQRAKEVALKMIREKRFENKSILIFGLGFNQVVENSDELKPVAIYKKVNGKIEIREHERTTTTD